MAARVMKPGNAKRPRGGPADVSRHHQKRPCLNYYSTAAISASVYVGRRHLGFIIDESGQCAALTPERALIGTFPNRRSAFLAILVEPRGPSA
jgi:hypothetical protein